MKSNRVLIAIVVVVATILATTMAATQIQLPLFQQEAAAQNATATTNQTAGNQTQGGGSAAIRATMGNLTQADFGPVTDSLNTARESLQTNDTTAAYDAVNSVDSELFGLANDQGEQNMKAVMQQFKPIQDSMDSTRDALKNNDTAKALPQLNTADTELLKITQQLPPEEEEGEGEEG
jgi:type II secretory pathway pseudopilin PulG